LELVVAFAALLAAAVLAAAPAAQSAAQERVVRRKARTQDVRGHTPSVRRIYKKIG